MDLMRTLVIPDSHDTPEQSKFRYEVLANLIEVEVFDNIVQLGDFSSFDSVSSYNKGKPRLAEGLRLKDDIDSGIEAFHILNGGLERLKRRSRKNKKAVYNPTLFWLEGNHEDRIRRWLLENPVMDGFVPESDLVGAAQSGWKVIPYSSYGFINGVAFTHVPHNPESGREITGIYAAQRAAMVHQHTVVFGHTHKRTVGSVTRVTPDNPEGSPVDAISCGCWLDYSPDYLNFHGPCTNWWSGVVILHHIDYGKVDVEFVSMDAVYKDYS